MSSFVDWYRGVFGVGMFGRQGGCDCMRVSRQYRMM